MKSMIAAQMPLVCAATLHSLEDSLDGEQALCRNFVFRYVDMWPLRFERIHDAVTAAHSEDALDATLSLRSSSMMVGAVRLGELATDIIQLLERGSYAAAAKNLIALRICGNQTTSQLAAGYVNAA